MSPSTFESDVATVGPQDVDGAGDLAPKVVKQQEAHEMIRMVRANYPVDLVILEQRDEDRARTAALNADEVFEAVCDAFGDEEAKGGVVKVLSARVRGRAQPLEEKAVCVLWETPSGRTARGAVGYSDLTKSLDAFDRMIASGEITEVDETDPKDLARTVERQEDQIRRLNAQVAGGEDDPAVAAGLTREDVESMVKQAISEGAEDAIAERDEEIERLKAELAAKNDAGDGDGNDAAAARPETEDLTKQDAADAASTTEAEAGIAPVAEGGTFDEANGTGGEAEVEPTPPEPVEAPAGKQQELLAKMESFSPEQLAALVEAEEAAKRPRQKVIAAAKAQQSAED